MTRNTIDFGIDLGTTNSVIACMDRGELAVVKNAVTGSEITPSAVKVNAKGTIIVGQNAYDEAESDASNIATEFKRWIGNGGHSEFHFEKSGKRMTAAGLSSEVLKVLKASASSRFQDEDIRASVITIPAMFPIPACEETVAAAKLAGIEICPLLQEPIAAAIAYGYQAETLNGNLLVFDLGGGTFDTSILTAKDGRLVVVGHDGDDKLGGKDYDWALVEVILQKLRKEYGNIPFSRDGSMRGTAARLKYLAEKAKKDLSISPTAPVEVKRLDGEWSEVDTEIELTRADLQKATEGLTRRCLDICQRALRSARLSKSDLSAVIDVGGQTMTPYIREMVNAELGKADSRLDPLTVVAKGAALFASTRKIPSRSSGKITAGMVEVKVAYSPVSPDLDAEVGFAVQPQIQGARLTVTRSDGGWSSGAIAIPSNGRVDATIVLRAKKANAFQAEIRDAAGTLVSTVNDCGFTITHGLAVAKATTSQAFSVALEDNAIQVIIPRGTPLPAKGTQTFHTNREIVAGNPKSVLPIYVVEGDNPRADRNRKIGEVIVRGNEIKRSLPPGETVEITYRLDESKNLSVEAVFSVLREPIAAHFDGERIELDTEEIEIELQKERTRLERIEQAAPDKINTEAAQQIVAIERVKDAAAAVGEHDAKQAAMDRLIELKKVLDALERSSSWEIVVAKFESYRYDGDYIQAFGKPKQHADFLAALENAESALSSHDENALRDSLERMTDIYWDITRERDDFWKMQFTMLNDEGQFVDPLRSEQLKEEGFRALKREDIGTLRTIVIELMDLQPSWQKGKLDMRFSDAGLRKL